LVVAARSSEFTSRRDNVEAHARQSAADERSHLEFVAQTGMIAEPGLRPEDRAVAGDGFRTLLRPVGGLANLGQRLQPMGIVDNEITRDTSPQIPACFLKASRGFRGVRPAFQRFRADLGELCRGFSLHGNYFLNVFTHLSQQKGAAAQVVLLSQ
jgi:hypothetical protein